MRRLAAVFALTLIAVLTAAPNARAASADTAALQVALKALHLYKGSIDGVAGPGTRRAVRRFQRKHRLRADGIAGAQTKRRLGKRGRPRLGSRVMRRGHRGWDVAALQFLLRRRGCRVGAIDGGFGAATNRALKRCQRRYGLTADGLAGSSTIRALRSGRPRRTVRRSRVRGVSGPVRFLRPVQAPITSVFGMRAGRPHQGLDFPAPTGTPVTAAGVGVVTFAGWDSGGFGNLVIVTHRLGFQTYYAHMNSISVSPGQPVSGGVPVGTIGSTGRSTGPHLHWEVRLNGTPIDPIGRLLG